MVQKHKIQLYPLYKRLTLDPKTQIILKVKRMEKLFHSNSN